MKIIAFFAIFSMILMPLTSASCFGSGVSWDDKDAAFNAARSVCRYGELAFNYAGGETKRRCVNGPRVKYDFTIRRVGTTKRFLDPNECYDGLQKEIKGCGRGGSSRYTNWEYTSDPNTGRC